MDRRDEGNAERTDYRVLFVCTGNICRSPTAEGVFLARLRERGLHDRVAVGSAGTHDYHVGEPPDPRAQRHARRRGVDLSALRARLLVARDFDSADLLLVMDAHNEDAALDLCPPALRHKLRRLASFGRRHAGDTVPDPYYGEAQAFEHALDLIEDACDGLLAHVERELQARDARSRGAG